MVDDPRFVLWSSVDDKSDETRNACRISEFLNEALTAVLLDRSVASIDAFEKFVRLRFAPVIVASLRLARCKLAFVKSASLRSARYRST